MEIGHIIENNSNIVHCITKKIINLMQEHPDYEIKVLVCDEVTMSNDEWLLDDFVDVEICEILDCSTPWWDGLTTCTDRNKFENYCYKRIRWLLRGHLGRRPTDEEVEAAWQEVKEAHEPYWEKCIAIKVYN